MQRFQKGLLKWSFCIMMFKVLSVIFYHAGKVKPISNLTLMLKVKSIIFQCTSTVLKFNSCFINYKFAGFSHKISSDSLIHIFLRSKQKESISFLCTSQILHIEWVVSSEHTEYKCGTKIFIFLFPRFLQIKKNLPTEGSAKDQLLMNEMEALKKIISKLDFIWLLYYIHLSSFNG